MKQLLVVAVVALAAVALYATSAPAGEQAVTPKQFTALSKRVKTLEQDNKDIKTLLIVIIGCAFDQGAIPVTKAPQFHITGTGEATDFYALTTNNQECVDLINSPAARRIMRSASG